MAAGAPVGRQPRGQRLQSRLGGRQRLGHCEEAGHHAFDIAVENGGRPVEGDGGDGGGSIGPDPGKRLKALLGLGKTAAQIEGHDTGAFQQVARPRVVTQPRPFCHDIGIRRRRQVAHPGPERREAVEVVANGGDGRLLQHDLGQPNGVRVWPNAMDEFPRPHPPGQIPCVAVVPVHQGGFHLGVTQALSAFGQGVIG